MKKISETREPAGEWRSVGKDSIESMGAMGEIIRSVFECPCGKGKIFTTFENLQGYRDSYASIGCEECNKIYRVHYNWALNRDEPRLEKM